MALVSSMCWIARGVSRALDVWVSPLITAGRKSEAARAVGFVAGSAAFLITIPVWGPAGLAAGASDDGSLPQPEITTKTDSTPTTIRATRSIAQLRNTRGDE